MQNYHLVEVSINTYIEWFRNATMWSRTPKMILIKHGCHMPPYQAKLSYIPTVKFGVPLASVQLEFSTI